jgi:long-chain acyl-CoA synthetase
MIFKGSPDKTALVYKEQKVSYIELNQLMLQFSDLITVSNSKVAIYSENRLEWVYAFYAAWLNNCTVVPIDSGASVEDVRYIMNDCEPSVVFTSNGLKEQFDKVKENLNYSVDTIVFDDIKRTSGEKISAAKNFPANKEKTAVIIYTSGTTGKPKGVMLSYVNLLANIRAVTKDVVIYTAGREVLMLLPMHHIFPLVGSMVAPLSVGGTVVMSPSMQSPDLMETLKNNNVAIMIGVPRLYELIYNGLKTKIFASFVGRFFYGLVKLSGSKAFAKKIFKKVHDGLGGNIEYMVCGGAALNHDVGRFFKVLGFEVLEGFGMTEAAPMITFTRPGKVKIGSPGQPLTGIDIEIRDGEIVAKGENIMQGYYNKPEETTEALKDGWLYTGDLGHFDKNGFLYITGRKKDIIVLANGKNISPVEIEMKLESKVEAVKEAAVFMYHNQLHAVIVPDFKFLSEQNVENPATFFKESILPSFNKELSSYKRIMQFTLVKQELPRTKLGKIQRFKLAELIENIAEESKKEVEHPDSEEYKMVRQFIENEVDMEISPDDHIEYDIALDSLGKLSLIDFIERTFGVKLEEESLLSFPSIRQMVEHIKSNKLWQKLESTNWTETLKEKVNLKLPKSWPTISIIKNMSKFFFKIYFRFKVDGYKNLPEGPFIIAPNHQSFFDGLFVASFLRRKTMKSTYFYAKKKHVNNWFMKFLANRNNIIVVDLNKGLQESIQKMAEVLRNGRNLIIFPEGTRTKTGELGEFKKMFAILSKEMNVPVVPVAINGAYNALPTGKKVPKLFSKVEVSFLQPVYPQEYTHDSLTEKVYNDIDARLGVV